MIVKVINKGITLDLKNKQEVIDYLRLMGYGTAILLPDGTYQVETQGYCLPAIQRVS